MCVCVRESLGEDARKRESECELNCIDAKELKVLG